MQNVPSDWHRIREVRGSSSYVVLQRQVQKPGAEDFLILSPVSSKEALQSSPASSDDRADARSLLPHTPRLSSHMVSVANINPFSIDGCRHFRVGTRRPVSSSQMGGAIAHRA